jgi:hypothetical protein
MKFPVMDMMKDARYCIWLFTLMEMSLKYKFIEFNTYDPFGTIILSLL